MIAFLLDVYILVIWLVFFRFKLLKFDLKAKISAAVIGVVLILGMLIAVNFMHPQTLDARVFQHVIQVASRVPEAGRVVEVPVQPNVPVKQGEVLFRIDPKPFELEVERLKASLAVAEQTVPQLKAAHEAATAEVERAKAQLTLAQIEHERAVKLRQSDANTQQQVDEKKRNLDTATNVDRSAVAAQEEARIGIDIGVQKIAETKATLAKAEFDLQETTVKAPADGFVTNLELRPGFVVAPGQSVMSFVVDPEGVVAATFPQEYLGYIEPGNDVEMAFDYYPGKTLRGKVDAVIMASGQGQLGPSGELPTVVEGDARGRYAVKIRMNEDDMQAYPLPAGAGGSAAVYTNHGGAFKVVRRVILRWYTWLNYIKLSM